MANVDDPTGTQPAGNPAGFERAIADPSPHIDPERYQQLERFYSETAPVLEKLRPFDADIKALVEGDDGYREFQRTSRESYYDMQKRLEKEREAEIPESEKRLLSALDERLGKFKPVLDDYESRAQAEQRKAQEASQEFARKETEYADRLVAEGKLTNDEINELAEYAMTLHQKSVKDGNPRFVGIEEVYKKVYGRAEVKAQKPVARSLRSTAGVTGVPGASKPPEDRSNLAKPGGITRHVLGVLNSQRKTG